VNDGSTDNSRKIIEDTISKIKTKTTFINIGNKGNCYARNLAISKAEGKYIAFLDADDVWLPDKLEKQLKMLSKHDDYDGIFCGYFRFGMDSNLQSPQTQFLWNSDSIFKWMILESIGPALNSTLLIKKELLQYLGGFDEELISFAEDLELAWRLNLNGKIISQDEYLVQVRTWSEQTHSNFKKMESALLYVYKKHFQIGSLEYRIASNNLSVWSGIKNLQICQLIKGLSFILKGIAGSPKHSTKLLIRLLIRNFR
jgi:glycosyltransferase involved in cell wall biosynthesis